jgi:hypothetical protein
MAIATTLKSYERHLSAVAMAAGFVIDNFSFGRIDHPATQIVLASYLVVAAITIAVFHYYAEKAEQCGENFRWAGVVSGIIQFCFGGLWSAFLIFYSRSAVVATAWPYLAILAAIFIGNEIFREYRSRLNFSAILFFFALSSYCTFVVPMFTGTLDHRTFLIAGTISIGIFAVFVALLALLAHLRIRRDIRTIGLGALGVFICLNTFYYLNVLPPLPLALVDSALVPSRAQVIARYHEAPKIVPWYSRLRHAPVLQLASGQTLYAYSAVFAPTHLATQIVHEWEWLDPASNQWRTETVIAFPISGGREWGYRGYSFKTNLRAGSWRVDVETSEGRIIERLRFEVNDGLPASK